MAAPSNGANDDVTVEAVEGVMDFPLPEVKDFRLGLYGGYEFVLYRLSILTNLGYTIYQMEPA